MCLNLSILFGCTMDLARDVDSKNVDQFQAVVASYVGLAAASLSATMELAYASQVSVERVYVAITMMDAETYSIADRAQASRRA